MKNNAGINICLPKIQLTNLTPLSLVIIICVFLTQDIQYASVCQLRGRILRIFRAFLRALRSKMYGWLFDRSRTEGTRFENHPLISNLRTGPLEMLESSEGPRLTEHWLLYVRRQKRHQLRAQNCWGQLQMFLQRVLISQGNYSHVLNVVGADVTGGGRRAKVGREN